MRKCKTDVEEMLRENDEVEIQYCRVTSRADSAEKGRRCIQRCKRDGGIFKN